MTIWQFLLLFYLVQGSKGVHTSLTAITELAIPRSSNEDVVIMCDVVDGHDYSPLWMISGRQITNTTKEFIIEPSQDGSSSRINITRDNRDLIGQDIIPVQCNTEKSGNFTVILGTEKLNIVLFDAPGSVEHIEFVNYNDSHLMLKWQRPNHFNLQVPVTYHYIITNSRGVKEKDCITPDLFVLVKKHGPTCTKHDFNVYPETSAGPGPCTVITHTIPLSLDIEPVSMSQRVVSLSLSKFSPEISVSFMGATNCSVTFPVTNHTVAVEGLQGEVVLNSVPVNSTVNVSINPTVIHGLSLNQIVRIIITACTELTCLSPSLPLVAVTTDTQTASVVFYSTAVSINCTFATGSTANGCLFVFRLISQNTTENITISYSGSGGSNSSCDQLSNTREAYYEEVMVYDIESDGSIGSLSISASVTVYDDPDNFTCLTCPTTCQNNGSEGKGMNFIAGVAAPGYILFFLVIVPAVVILITYGIRRRRCRCVPFPNRG